MCDRNTGLLSFFLFVSSIIGQRHTHEVSFRINAAHPRTAQLSQSKNQPIPP